MRWFQHEPLLRRSPTQPASTRPAPSPTPSPSPLCTKRGRRTVQRRVVTLNRRASAIRAREGAQAQWPGRPILTTNLRDSCTGRSADAVARWGPDVQRPPGPETGAGREGCGEGDLRGRDPAVPSIGLAETRGNGGGRDPGRSNPGRFRRGSNHIGGVPQLVVLHNGARTEDVGRFRGRTCREPFANPTVRPRVSGSSAAGRHRRPWPPVCCASRR